MFQESTESRFEDRERYGIHSIQRKENFYQMRGHDGNAVYDVSSWRLLIWGWIWLGCASMARGLNRTDLLNYCYISGFFLWLRG